MLNGPVISNTVIITSPQWLTPHMLFSRCALSCGNTAILEYLYLFIFGHVITESLCSMDLSHSMLLLLFGLACCGHILGFLFLFVCCLLDWISLLGLFLEWFCLRFSRSYLPRFFLRYICLFLSGSSELCMNSWFCKLKDLSYWHYICTWVLHCSVC